MLTAALRKTWEAEKSFHVVPASRVGHGEQLASTNAHLYIISAPMCLFLKILVTATMAEPSVLPLALRGTVGLGLRVPAPHQKPTQREEAQAHGSLLPVVAQARHADIHAFTRKKRADRHRHVDHDATDAVGADEGHWRWRRRRGTVLGQHRGLRALAAALDELTT